MRIFASLVVLGAVSVGCSSDPVMGGADAATGDVSVTDGGGGDGGGGDSAMGDAAVTDTGGGDTAVTPADVPDPHGGLKLPRCEDTEPMGDVTLDPVASTLVATRAPVQTRLTQPILMQSANPANESGEMMYRGMHFDQWRRGDGWARVRRTELGGPSTAPTGERKSILWFVQFSDTQLVDDESPSRLALLDSPAASGAIRAQEAFLPRAIAAMNRTLTALMRPERPFQFGVVAGDCADSAQYNETRWFIASMDGERGINNDSGDDDDPIPGPGNDPKDPFDGVPFPAPWYFVPGNHDVEIVGVNQITDLGRMNAIGMRTIAGTRDYTQWWAPPRRGTVVPDPNRRLLDRADFPMELQHTAAHPGPIGHGTTALMNPAAGLNYTADLVPGLVRLIAIDSSDFTGGSPGMITHTAINTFLRPALEQAQRDGVLVMLASHHPTSSMNRLSGEFGAEVPDAADPAEVEHLVAGFPNVIAWLVGHDHDLRVRPIRGADSAHPGYWEIQSGSVADWPSLSRTLEIVNNGDGTLSIFGTLIGINPQNCMERRFLRLSMMEYLAAWDTNHMGVDHDRNVELVIPIPPSAMAAVTRASATAPTRIESETTLRGMR